jgi:hypothetical protein
MRHGCRGFAGVPVWSTVLPDYWIERPPFSAGRATEAAVDAFLQLAGADGGRRLLDVDALLRETPRVVRWRFLCSLAARRRIAFHGTGDPRIERFEPREPVDFTPFGTQRAVFARATRSGRCSMRSSTAAATG